MGTTHKTSQQAQFDPASMALFGQLTNSLGPMLTGYMQNPFGNPFFQTQSQMGTRQAQQLGGTQMSNLTRNLTGSGLLGGASSPAGLEMLQNQARANTGLTSQLGFLNPVQNALGMQQWAGGLGANYRPLQTGQNQTESTSGLGTWLPQLANMGLGLATGGLGGGLFGAAKAAGGGLPSGFDFGGAFSAPTGFAGAPMGFGLGGVPGGFGGASSPFSYGGAGNLTPPPAPPF